MYSLLFGFQTEKRDKSFLPGSTIYLCWHWISRFTSKDGAPSVARCGSFYTFVSSPYILAPLSPILIMWSVTGSRHNHACTQRTLVMPCCLPFVLRGPLPQAPTRPYVPGSAYTYVIFQPSTRGAIAATVSWSTVTKVTWVLNGSGKVQTKAACLTPQRGFKAVCTLTLQRTAFLIYLAIPFHLWTQSGIETQFTQLSPAFSPWGLRPVPSFLKCWVLVILCLWMSFCIPSLCYCHVGQRPHVLWAASLLI